MSAMVVGIRVQRSWYPNSAPACEYVRIPPGSLSTLAMIKPGPRTARNATILALASANIDFLRVAIECMKADGSLYFRLVVFPLNGGFQLYEIANAERKTLKRKAPSSCTHR